MGTCKNRTNEPNFYADFDAEIATALAGQAAIAVENAQLFEQAQFEINERLRVEAALEAERASLARRVDERTAALQAANTELARASQLRDEFLASMSHELRTPLNAILGLSEALQEQVYGLLNEKQLKSLNTIEESGRHLLALINDILDISKIEADKLTLHTGPISVEAVCQASLRLIKQSAQDKQITVVYSCDSVVSNIQADQRRLQQILVNLLSNAVKFTLPNGKVGLEVEYDPTQQAICFVVWDTGIGISADDMERLFEPFVQLDSSLARQYTGTGLGLVLVKRLAELHGGRVWAESELEKGSRFTVSLPESGNVERVEVTTSPDTEAPPDAARVFMKSPLLLLVEDNANNSFTMTEYLRMNGYQIIEAHNGQEAIQRAKEVRPDIIIIMDIQMPDMDGFEVCRRLRSDPLLAEVPVIIVTALDDRDSRVEGIEAGADDFISKPFDRIELRARIRTISRLNRYRLLLSERARFE